MQCAALSGTTWRLRWAATLTTMPTRSTRRLQVSFTGGGFVRRAWGPGWAARSGAEICKADLCAAPLCELSVLLLLCCTTSSQRSSCCAHAAGSLLSPAIEEGKELEEADSAAESARAQAEAVALAAEAEAEADAAAAEAAAEEAAAREAAAAAAQSASAAARAAAEEEEGMEEEGTVDDYADDDDDDETGYSVDDEGELAGEAAGEAKISAVRAFSAALAAAEAAEAAAVAAESWPGEEGAQRAAAFRREAEAAVAAAAAAAVVVGETWHPFLRVCRSCHAAALWTAACRDLVSSFQANQRHPGLAAKRGRCLACCQLSARSVQPHGPGMPAAAGQTDIPALTLPPVGSAFQAMPWTTCCRSGTAPRRRRRRRRPQRLSAAARLTLSRC